MNWAGQSAFPGGSRRSLPPVASLNSDVVFIIIAIVIVVIIIIIIVLTWLWSRQQLWLKVALSLWPLPKGISLVGLRDKTVTRLWLSLLHRWGNNSGDDSGDDGDVSVALTCHSCPHYRPLNSKQTLQLSPLPECIISEEMDQLNIIRPSKRVLEKRLFFFWRKVSKSLRVIDLQKRFK